MRKLKENYGNWECNTKNTNQNNHSIKKNTYFEFNRTYFNVKSQTNSIEKPFLEYKTDFGKIGYITKQN